jgi:hypothetical protein
LTLGLQNEAIAYGIVKVAGYLFHSRGTMGSDGAIIIAHGELM